MEAQPRRLGEKRSRKRFALDSLVWARGRGRLARATAVAIRHRGERGFFCRPERARKMTDY